VQFRPHFFPFTEPSLEVYVKSKALKGGERWIEVAGSGVVHPAVFEQVNKARGDKAYDPEKWSGYAFGLGMDRLAMILFDIPDIRMLIGSQFAKWTTAAARNAKSFAARRITKWAIKFRSRFRARSCRTELRFEKTNSAVSKATGCFAAPSSSASARTRLVF